jgi:hypothetical protein
VLTQGRGEEGEVRVSSDRSESDRIGQEETHEAVLILSISVSTLELAVEANVW